MDKKLHTSVLLKESIEALNIKPEGTYVDCTLGEGGHSIAILSKLKTGSLVSIDYDPNAIAFVKENYGQELKEKNWKLVVSNFTKISTIVEGGADGILMDLGFSSRQLEMGVGLSYNKDDQELDMRLDPSLMVKAKDLLHYYSEKELTALFRRLGEEKFSSKIAREIKRVNNINTVGDLKSLIYRVVPAAALREESHHPARRVFQALRIAVNDELNSLEKALDEGFKVLNKNGRLVVITFHSLEDRIVKTFCKNKEDIGEGVSINGVITPNEKEININSRAHSAKLRTLEKK